MKKIIRRWLSIDERIILQKITIENLEKINIYLKEVNRLQEHDINNDCETHARKRRV